MKESQIRILIASLCGLIVALFLWTSNNQEAIAEELPEVAPVQRIITETACETYEQTPEDIAEETYYDSLEELAICVEAEAGNQNLTGKRMVVAVILNRVDDPDWPDTISGVIEQPYQFASYWNGAMDRVTEPSEETFQAVRMTLEDRCWTDLYYFTAEGYGEYGTPWKQVGDHYFSKK